MGLERLPALGGHPPHKRTLTQRLIEKARKRPS